MNNVETRNIVLDICSEDTSPKLIGCGTHFWLRLMVSVGNTHPCSVHSNNHKGRRRSTGHTASCQSTSTKLNEKGHPCQTRPLRANLIVHHMPLDCSKYASTELAGDSRTSVANPSGEEN